MRKNVHSQLIQNSAPSVTRRRQCVIKIPQTSLLVGTFFCHFLQQTGNNNIYLRMNLQKIFQSILEKCMNVHVPIFTYSPNALMQIRYLEGGFFFHIQNAIEVFFPILHGKVTLIFMRFDQLSNKALGSADFILSR